MSAQKVPAWKLRQQEDLERAAAAKAAEAAVRACPTARALCGCQGDAQSTAKRQKNAFFATFF
jgi:hypothetical protein